MFMQMRLWAEFYAIVNI